MPTVGPEAGGADLMVCPYTQVVNASRRFAAAVHVFLTPTRDHEVEQLLSPARKNFTF